MRNGPWGWRHGGSVALLVSLGVGVSTGTGARGAEEPREKPGEAERSRFFEERAWPILKAECLRCHGGRKKIKGGLRLTSRAAVLRGGDSGPAVSLEKPAESRILRAIRYEDENLEMPPDGKLEAEEIEVLRRWVELGIPWSPTATPAAEAVEAERRPPRVTPEAKEFWSFRPLRRPAPPTARDPGWVENPIDAFVLRKLEDKGLRPAAPAERVALLRRASYDLTGLPPTPAEVDAFLENDSSDPFPDAVDRLLDSPRYGERWGRHWLDLVRFGETHSFERDSVKPNAWRYRDYVIRSFNDDKPYDQFIREQLAGDELDQVTPDTVIATGYYRLGPWDDEPTDRLQARYDELDDIVATTAQVFLGLTLNCARCHDHKLDPIPQEDYYRVLAFFHGILPTTKGNTVLTEIATEEERRERQLQLDELKARRQQLDQAIAALEEPAIAKLSEEERRAARNRKKRARLLKDRLPDLLDPKDLERHRRLVKESEQLKRERRPPLRQALSVKEGGPVPPETHVLVRGNAHVKGKTVQPGFPQVLGFPDPEIPAPPPDARTAGRRRVLAEWIASGTNPLTARVMANRIWQHHFGRGIARTPNNFGNIGQRPSHPALLDWLASELVESGWRLKHMHRLVMNSNAYRMSSKDRRASPGALELDPENDLFWRMDMRRLGAEEIRDSILAVNGKLNLKMGGPGSYPLIPREVLQGQSRPGSGWGSSSDVERSRRSIYIHVKRSLVTPFLEAFDFADTDSTCPVRFATTQPTQALTMLNSEFMGRQAGAFAARVEREAGKRPEEQVALALRLALGRRLAPEETRSGVELLRSLQESEGLSAEAARKQFCLMVLNLNEFIYLD